MGEPKKSYRSRASARVRARAFRNDGSNSVHAQVSSSAAIPDRDDLWNPRPLIRLVPHDRPAYVPLPSGLHMADWPHRHLPTETCKRGTAGIAGDTDTGHPGTTPAMNDGGTKKNARRVDARWDACAICLGDCRDHDDHGGESHRMVRWLPARKRPETA